MKKQALLVFAVAALLPGCSNDTDTNTGNDTRVSLQVSGGISIRTRAQDKDWNKGDAIGIYMVDAGSMDIAEGAENRRYITAEGDGKFSPAPDNTVYFPVDGSATDFLAYYPFEAALTDGALSVDAGSQTDQAAIDLMTAKTVSTADEPLDKNHSKVSLAFTHRLTKLSLTIAAGNGMAAEDLAGLEVEITNQRAKGSYSPLSETFSVASEPVQTIALNTAASGTSAVAILLPTTGPEGINPIVAGRQLVFTLAGTGEVFRWDIPDSKSFKQGDKNIYDITINRTSLDVTATIVDWNEGNEGGEPGSAE
ncbi:fimbrillin family protein [Bacteroides fluxus]|uniref:fimbrillin family protein n=1 Tax=Bacteroides fluxus TaxID=626930 RepID=UPI002357B970|nr:fimbrillin family protein [Bacteroides fluxus]